MKVEELCRLNEWNLEIKYSNYTQKWYATIDRLEEKKGAILSSVCSRHLDSPDEALQNLAEGLSGKKVVYDAYGKNRREFSLPTISVDNAPTQTEGE